ncbi:hypothetical protein C8R45DRAFT_935450 [Mycena sanguinolenta]|nr:hypothetical protein C8R45DRAFT_935450 [Mycena sanguinolenta]
MVDHVGKFMQTLHKIYTYIESQQESNKIKQLFRTINMNNLVKDCYKELDEGKKVFGVGHIAFFVPGLNILSQVDAIGAMFKDIREVQKQAEIKHTELLELISYMSETSTTTDGSSIFHGRETELKDIMKMLLDQQSSMIAILGGDLNKDSLAALIGLHIGLNPGKDLTKPVVQYFSKQPSCLLVLGNLETVWEPIQSRSSVEEFLSLLTDIKDLTLIITMRGAERSARVRWTHPFLSPLQPLSNNAAQQTFMDITDNAHSVEDFNQLLSFTDNMPLAVDLLAHLVDYEGLENALARWETEKTSMLSVGYDRKSNLDASISLSLSSPRISSASKELLSLLSILPNGLSDAELLQSKLPISNILSCKAVLLATSLAYEDNNKQLLVLMPIRQYVQQFLPPSPFLVHSLRVHFYELLELYQKYTDGQLKPVISQITANLANLQDILQQGLVTGTSNLPATIYCIISLNSFCRVTGRGISSFMDHIQHILSQSSNYRLKLHFIIEIQKSYQYYPTAFIEQMLVQAKFYYAASLFIHWKSSSSSALQFAQRAQEFAKVSGSIKQQYIALLHIAQLKVFDGDYSTGCKVASEAQQLSDLSMDLYYSARALRLQGQCSRYLGNYHKSLERLHGARENLNICGMSGGLIDGYISLSQAEVYLLKSEYVQAQRTYSGIAEKMPPDQPSDPHGIAFVNLAYIGIQIGCSAANISKELDIATAIFKSVHHPDLQQCKLVEACLNLRDHTFDLAQKEFEEWFHFSIPELKSLCLEQLANIKAWPARQGQSRWPVIYLGFTYKVKEKLALHKALMFLGDVFLVNKDEDTACMLEYEPVACCHRRRPTSPGNKGSCTYIISPEFLCCSLLILELV